MIRGQTRAQTRIADTSLGRNGQMALILRNSRWAERQTLMCSHMVRLESKTTPRFLALGLKGTRISPTWKWLPQETLELERVPIVLSFASVLSSLSLSLLDSIQTLKCSPHCSACLIRVPYSAEGGRTEKLCIIWKLVKATTVLVDDAWSGLGIKNT